VKGLCDSGHPGGPATTPSGSGRNRSILQKNGHKVLARLLKGNWDHLGTAEVIKERYGIALSTLRRGVD